MTLPTSGVISATMVNEELGRAGNSAFSMNSDDTRLLAKRPTGAIAFSDFHGKSSEIVVTLKDQSNVTLKDLFSEQDWASDTTKRVFIPKGMEVGGLGGNPAILVVPQGDPQTSSFGGSLGLDVEGVVTGTGGAANGGEGGPAVWANQKGRSGQLLNITNKGIIRAGGGGGGRGGTGGTGAASLREPASGEHYQGPMWSGRFTWNVSWEEGDPVELTLTWEGQVVYSRTIGWETVTQVTVGAHTYYRGSSRFEDDYEGYSYGIYRTSGSTSNGGSGGAGGTGEGYKQARGTGAGGVAGGQNAGEGGAGGTGGLYGSAGAAGQSGKNGNSGTGLSGSAGGLSGHYIRQHENVLLNNTGTLLGRV